VRLAAQVDANQKAIVDALRSIGATVQSLAAVGKGVPDLLVGFRGNMFLLEVKDGRKPPSAQRLTALQVSWHSTWRGPPVSVVRNVTEALRAVGARPMPEVDR
jgi:hypothetical protein